MKNQQLLVLLKNISSSLAPEKLYADSKVDLIDIIDAKLFTESVDKVFDQTTIQQMQENSDSELGLEALQKLNVILGQRWGYTQHTHLSFDLKPDNISNMFCKEIAIMLNKHFANMKMPNGSMKKYSIPLAGKIQHILKDSGTKMRVENLWLVSYMGFLTPDDESLSRELVYRTFAWPWVISNTDESPRRQLVVSLKEDLEKVSISGQSSLAGIKAALSTHGIKSPDAVTHGVKFSPGLLSAYQTAMRAYNAMDQLSGKKISLADATQNLIDGLKKGSIIGGASESTANDEAYLAIIEFRKLLDYCAEADKENVKEIFGKLYDVLMPEQVANNRNALAGEFCVYNQYKKLEDILRGSHQKLSAIYPLIPNDELIQEFVAQKRNLDENIANLTTSPELKLVSRTNLPSDMSKNFRLKENYFAIIRRLVETNAAFLTGEKLLALVEGIEQGSDVNGFLEDEQFLELYNYIQPQEKEVFIRLCSINNLFLLLKLQHKAGDDSLIDLIKRNPELLLDKINSVTSLSALLKLPYAEELALLIDDRKAKVILRTVDDVKTILANIDCPTADKASSAILKKIDLHKLIADTLEAENDSDDKIIPFIMELYVPKLSVNRIHLNESFDYFCECFLQVKGSGHIASLIIQAENQYIDLLIKHNNFLEIADDLSLENRNSLIQLFVKVNNLLVADLDKEVLEKLKSSYNPSDFLKYSYDFLIKANNELDALLKKYPAIANLVTAEQKFFSSIVFTPVDETKNSSEYFHSKFYTGNDEIMNLLETIVANSHFIGKGLKEYDPILATETARQMNGAITALQQEATYFSTLMNNRGWINSFKQKCLETIKYKNNSIIRIFDKNDLDVDVQKLADKKELAIDNILSFVFDERLRQKLELAFAKDLVKIRRIRLNYKLPYKLAPEKVKDMSDEKVNYIYKSVRLKELLSIGEIPYEISLKAMACVADNYGLQELLAKKVISCNEIELMSPQTMDCIKSNYILRELLAKKVISYDDIELMSPQTMACIESNYNLRELLAEKVISLENIAKLSRQSIIAIEKSCKVVKSLREKEVTVEDLTPEYLHRVVEPDVLEIFRQEEAISKVGDPTLAEFFRENPRIFTLYLDKKIPDEFLGQLIGDQFLCKVIKRDYSLWQILEESFLKIEMLPLISGILLAKIEYYESKFWNEVGIFLKNGKMKIEDLTSLSKEHQQFYSKNYELVNQLIHNDQLTMQEFGAIANQYLAQVNSVSYTLLDASQQTKLDATKTFNGQHAIPAPMLWKCGDYLGLPRHENAAPEENQQSPSRNPPLPK